MPFDPDTTWPKLVQLVTVGARSLVYNLIEAKEAYDAWEVWRDGRNNQQMRNALGVGVPDVVALRDGFEAFLTLHSAAVGGSVVQDNLLDKWRKFQ